MKVSGYNDVSMMWKLNSACQTLPTICFIKPLKIKYLLALMNLHGLLLLLCSLSLSGAEKKRSHQ